MEAAIFDTTVWIDFMNAVAICYDFLLVHSHTDFDKIIPYRTLRTLR